MRELDVFFKKSYGRIIGSTSCVLALLGSANLFAGGDGRSPTEKKIEDGWVYVDSPSFSAQEAGEVPEAHQALKLVNKYMTENVGGVLGAAYTGAHDQQGYKNAIASIRSNFPEDLVAQRAALKQLKEHYAASKDAINDRGEGHRLRTDASFHHDEINRHLKGFEAHIQQQEAQKETAEEKHLSHTVGSEASHQVTDRGEKKSTAAQNITQTTKPVFKVTKANGNFSSVETPVKVKTVSGGKQVAATPRAPLLHAETNVAATPRAPLPRAETKVPATPRAPLPRAEKKVVTPPVHRVEK